MAIYLRDRSLKVIGRIEECGNGVKKLYDAHSNFRGQYDTSTNNTFDASMRFIGKGDLLCTLLQG